MALATGLVDGDEVKTPVASAKSTKSIPTSLPAASSPSLREGRRRGTRLRGGIHRNVRCQAVAASKFQGNGISVVGTSSKTAHRYEYPDTVRNNAVDSLIFRHGAPMATSKAEIKVIDGTFVVLTYLA